LRSSKQAVAYAANCSSSSPVASNLSGGVEVENLDMQVDDIDIGHRARVQRLIARSAVAAAPPRFLRGTSEMMACDLRLGQK
jgi:hypothetical protein